MLLQILPGKVGNYEIEGDRKGGVRRKEVEEKREKGGRKKNQ